MECFSSVLIVLKIMPKVGLYLKGSQLKEFSQHHILRKLGIKPKLRRLRNPKKKAIKY